MKHAVARCPFLRNNPQAVDSLTPTVSRVNAGSDNNDEAALATSSHDGMEAGAQPPIGADAMKFLAGKCPVMAPVIHSPGECARRASVHMYVCVRMCVRMFTCETPCVHHVFDL